MLSPSASSELTIDVRRRLLEVARGSIIYGLELGHPLPVTVEREPIPLRREQGCFVTLKRRGELRGCMGGLKAVWPIIQAVSYYSYQSAFRDPRFPGMTDEEVVEVDISLSLLSTPEPLTCATEEELLSQIEPGRHGLILSDGLRQATLLPSVWQMAPDPQVFLAHLRRKAGLPKNYWSRKLRFQRYTAEMISETSGSGGAGKSALSAS